MKLLVTIDVEEEGLFRGDYAADRVSARNVQTLVKLDPIFREYGIQPSLMVTYQATQDPANLELLAALRQKWNGEIGAHLHHWNTPPLEPLPYKSPVPSELIPTGLLEDKLHNLLDAVTKAGTEPVSFRMGRFNLGPKMFSLLEKKSPILVDSSVAPMRSEYGGPDHLSAPADPYYPDPEAPHSPGKSSILEVPVTAVPLIPGLGPILERMGRNSGMVQPAVRWAAKYLGSLSTQPMAVGLRRLRAAVMLHRARGGEVVTVFFHSSELMPGCCPRHKTESHVEAFLKKLNDYLRWLRIELGAESITLAKLAYDRRAQRRASLADRKVILNQ